MYYKLDSDFIVRNYFEPGTLNVKCKEINIYKIRHLTQKYK